MGKAARLRGNWEMQWEWKAWGIVMRWEKTARLRGGRKTYKMGKAVRLRVRWKKQKISFWKDCSVYRLCYFFSCKQKESPDSSQTELHTLVCWSRYIKHEPAPIVFLLFPLWTEALRRRTGFLFWVWSEFPAVPVTSVATTTTTMTMAKKAWKSSLLWIRAKFPTDCPPCSTSSQC